MNKSNKFSSEVRERAVRLAKAGIDPSVGSKGDRYDNALAEAI